MLVKGANGFYHAILYQQFPNIIILCQNGGNEAQRHPLKSRYDKYFQMWNP